tara:strand:+ start:379 stop:687 length:309 start_codon:yes stop_codon:yes gene_type:complete
MSNLKAAPISAKDFVSAYVQTHQTGGTIADLATTLNRSVGQVRAKRNSVAGQLKERGVLLPSLKRMERIGQSSVAYDQAADLLKSYLGESANSMDSTDSTDS